MNTEGELGDRAEASIMNTDKMKQSINKEKTNQQYYLEAVKRISWLQLLGFRLLDKCKSEMPLSQVLMSGLTWILGSKLLCTCILWEF